MPDLAPVCRPPTTNTEELLREATGLGDEARVASPPPPADHTAITGAEGAVHLGSDSVLLLTEGGGSAAAWGTAALIAPLAQLAFGLVMIEEAYEEGERRDVAHQSEVLRGALAALEGRADTPAAQIAARTSPGFAEGIRRVTAHWGERVEGGRMAEIARTIQATVRDGRDCVVRGEDRGPCFEQRYRSDPAFRHGVDHGRALREEHPEDFAALQRRQAEMSQMVANARVGTVRP